MLFAGLITMGRACAQQSDASDLVASTAPPSSALNDALALSNLHGKGKVPFHLKLSFELYDLSGKPQEQGTLDSWWAGPAGSSIEFTAPSLGKLNSLTPGNLPNDEARRSIYLIDALLDAVTEPYGFAPAAGKLVSVEKAEGKLILNCMHVEPETGLWPGSVYKTACVEKSSNTIRIVTDQSGTILRNRIGKFGTTQVALDVQVLFLGKQAISGHIEQLGSFDPTKTAVVLHPSAKASPDLDSSSKHPEIPDSVTAGKLLSHVDPSYPYAAREAHISGAVVLFVTLNEAGLITRLFPLASASSLLTPAAMDAVKRWSYQPYLLNGKPISVNSMVIVNFNLGGHDSWH